jgi:hypothetical protein
MAALAIPCIHKVNWDKGGGTGVSFAAMPGEDGGVGVEILITPEDSPIDIAITPFPPYIIPVPDFTVIFNDLFGKSHIQIQKDEIQKYLTQILRRVHNDYGFPLRDDHALQFPSDGVQKWLQARPDLAAVAPAMQADAAKIVTGAFGYDKSGPGIEERMVNQFLANAAINLWPFQAVMDLWNGIVVASTCKVPKFAPAPPPPPPPPPLPPKRQNCPDGWTQAECLEACGKIRQLSAAQMPLPPELLTVLSHFQDCILPPDGSWQYLPPAPQQGWNFVSIQPYPFLDGGTHLKRVPQEFWPYKWNRATQVDEIVVRGDNEQLPLYTLFINPPGTGTPYMVLPNGEFHCWPNMEPPADDGGGGDEPPPTIPPPPIQYTPLDQFLQLRQEFDALKQDYLNFKDSTNLSLDAIKRALWQSMTRGNFQASEVYAKDQPGWQGDNPPALQPPYPSAWQDLPAPGIPQVLEIPPIQEFPQVQEIPLDVAQLCLDLAPCIGEAITTYDTTIVQPEFQDIRDKCCGEEQPPTDEPPADICTEGEAKWGLMAECWLDTNTPAVPDGSIVFPVDLTGQNLQTELKNALSDNPSGWFADKIAGFADTMRAALLSGNIPTPPVPPTVTDVDSSYVYEQRPVI